MNNNTLSNPFRILINIEKQVAQASEAEQEAAPFRNGQIKLSALLMPESIAQIHSMFSQTLRLDEVLCLNCCAGYGFARLILVPEAVTNGQAERAFYAFPVYPPFSASPVTAVTQLHLLAAVVYMLNQPQVSHAAAIAFAAALAGCTNGALAGLFVIAEPDAAMVSVPGKILGQWSSSPDQYMVQGEVLNLPAGVVSHTAGIQLLNEEHATRFTGVPGFFTAPGNVAAVSLPIIGGDCLLGLFKLSAAPANSMADPELLFLSALTAQVAMYAASAEQYTAVSENVQWYKAASEISGVGLWEWRLPSDTVLFSDNLVKLLGLAPTQRVMPAMEWQNLIHPADLPMVMENMVAFLNGKSDVFRCEHRLRCNDGSYREMLSQGIALHRGALSTPIRFVGSATDITDVNRRMRVVRENEQKLYSLMRAIPDNIFIINRNAVIEECYENAPGTLLLPPAMLVQQNLRPYVSPELFAEGQRILEKVLSSGELFSVEYPLPIRGEQMYFEARILPLSRERVIAIVRNITDKILMHKEHLDTMRKYERAQASAGIGVWELDLATGESYWSKEVYNIMGINPEQNPPSINLAFDAMHPDDVDLYKEQLSQLLTNGTPSVGYVRFIQPGGKVVHTESRGEPVFEDGRVVRIHGTVYNVSEIAEAKNEALQLQQRYHAYIHESPIAICICNNIGQITEWNAAAEKVTSMAATELCGLQIGGLLTTVEGGLFSLQSLAEAGSRARLSKKNGEYIDVTVNIAPVADELFILFIQDVSELTNTLRELADTNRKLESYFNAIDDMVYFYNLKEKKAVFPNSVRDKLIGKPGPAYANDQDFWLDKLHPDDREEFIRKSSIITTTGSFNHQYRIIDIEGKVRWLWDRAWLVYGENNEPLRSDGIITDITTVKEYEQIIEAALAKEQELNSQRSRIISTLSHEFRTPLAGIYSSTEILEAYGATMSDAKKKKQYQQIKKSLDHLRELLDDVLLIHRAESGKLQFMPEPMQPAVVGSQLLQLFGPVASKRIKFTCSVKGKYLLDTRLLQQIFSNLINNALKYSPKKSSVEFNIAISAKGLKFTIRDFGIGIPAAEQHQVYDRFFRASNTLEFEGTGLGLPIVKNAVLTHGGTLEFTSSEGEGTTFIVVLPANKSSVTNKRGNLHA